MMFGAMAVCCMKFGVWDAKPFEDITNVEVYIAITMFITPFGLHI